MIKRFCLIVSCLVPLVTHAVEGKRTENFQTVCLQENSESLQKATDRYLSFIDQISKGEVFPQMETAAEIISPHCKKILNGQLFTQNREDFVSDLLSVYENQGAWKVYPADIIIDSSSNSVVLRIFIEMENFGTYTAIVILRYDSSYFITEINEVLSQVKGSYDFKDNQF
jgi:hypothetical protein